jgi:hypothetical protein
MGKKFGINTKAAEAQERKAIQEEIRSKETAKRKEAVEVANWTEGAYKNTKKEAQKAKRLDKLARKREREALERKEMESIVPASHSVRHALMERAEAASSSVGALEMPVYGASTIEDAVALMNVVACKADASASIEKHPERRMEAAFRRFEEMELPRLKEHFPGLRHSQLKERLFRLWKKSPDNPMNQLHISHRTTREEELHVLHEQNAAKLEQFRVDQ